MIKRKLSRNYNNKSYKHQQDILKQLTEIQSQLTDVLNPNQAAEDVLHRTTITAPIAGTVVNMQVHTIDGVIIAGKSIMDIVPSQDKLVVEAYIKPVDIDAVRPGLIAKVQLIAYKHRNTPWVDGQVNFVSADLVEEAQSKTMFYVARISIKANELKRLKNIALYPGMPVEVMIITDNRSPWVYFFTPVKESFQRAFREP